MSQRDDDERLDALAESFQASLRRGEAMPTHVAVIREALETRPG